MPLANSVARWDVEEAVSRGAQPQRTKARVRRVRRGWTRPSQKASPATHALYFLLALQPFPLCIAASEEADGGGTCGEPQEIASVDHPVAHHPAIFVSAPMRAQVAIFPHGCLIYPTSRSTVRSPDLSSLQHMLGLSLQLPDPLLRHPQLLRELCEGRGLFLLEAVPLDQHAPMALR